GFHLYVRDVQGGTTLLVDVDTNGFGPGVGPDAAPSMSTNGNLVVFDSPDVGLVANDRNRDPDVFLRDLTANTTELISARNAAFSSMSPNGPTTPPMSPDASGRWIAFASDADNLVANDTNGMRDVFVRDLSFGTNALISVSSNGFVGDGISCEPNI